MKIEKHLLSFTMSVLLAGSLLTGCGGNGTSANQPNAVTFENTTLTGMVTAVDGNTITLSLSQGMGMGGGRMEEMPEGTLPEKPEGEASDNNGQEPVEPSSDTNRQEPTEPSSDTNRQEPAESSTTFTLTLTDESVLQDISLSDITENSMLIITFGDAGNITSIALSSPEDGRGAMEAPGSSESSDTGTGATTITEDKQESDVSYISENADENALRVEGSVIYSGSSLRIQKTAGDTSNTESSDFYGLNAGFLSLEGASATLTDSVITTDAQGANGIFAYGSNTSVTVSNTSITTSADNSGGIDVTGGASIQASNLNIQTNGQSSAAIRSDRGGGTLNVTQGTYTTNGTGSPAVYCTADITVANATLTATASEGVVIEGKNPVTLTDCQVTGNMQGTYQGDETENLHTIMLYQSMSGDAEEGEAELTVSGGSITSQNGDLIYSTNTASTVNLNNVSLTLANDTLLRVAGNNSSRNWGTAGSNGADMKLYATHQELTGKIIVDEISTLTLSLAEESSFTGSINAEQEGGYGSGKS